MDAEQIAQVRRFDRLVTLRNELGLDTGYLSRLLRSLAAQAVITAESESADRRRPRVRLTSEGRAELAVYDGSRTSWPGRCWRRWARMSASVY